MNRNIHEPGPVLRALMIRRAVKLTGECPGCRVRRPLSPTTRHCWPCDNLVSDVHPHAATDRQRAPHGEMCNDCALRKGSPEQEDDYLRYAHLPHPADSERSFASTAEAILYQAKHATQIFWCHKPFLESEQEWGFDPKSGEITPLHGEHWKACGGWCKAFGKAHRAT